MSAVSPELPSELRSETARRCGSHPIRQLGNGSEVSAQDTVPFCLWSAAHHLPDFETTLWWTAKGMGDCDTTCAIVGGIVALSAPEIPVSCLERREALDA